MRIQYFFAVLILVSCLGTTESSIYFSISNDSEAIDYVNKKGVKNSYCLPFDKNSSDSIILILDYSLEELLMESNEFLELSNKERIPIFPYSKVFSYTNRLKTGGGLSVFTDKNGRVLKIMKNQ